MTATARRGIATIFLGVSGLTGDALLVVPGKWLYGCCVVAVALPTLVCLSWAQKAQVRESESRAVDARQEFSLAEAAHVKATDAVATSQALWAALEIEREWWHEQILAGHRDDCWYCQQGRN